MRKIFIAAFVTVFLFSVASAPVFAEVLTDSQTSATAVLQSHGYVLGASASTVSDDYGTGEPQDLGVYCPKLSTTMQRGARDVSTGGQVSELQIFLADYLNLNEEDIVTGYFGKLTQGYLMKFQTAQGLPSFGIAGSLTRAAIAKTCGTSATPSTPSTTPPVTDNSSTGVTTGCKLTRDKTSYTLGDSVTVTWSTKNATYASWVADTSGKDNFNLGGDKLGTTGSITFTANVLGNPYVALAAYSASGKSTLCKLIIPVTAPPAATTSLTFTSPSAGTSVAFEGNLPISWTMQNPRGYVYLQLVLADSNTNVSGLGSSAFQASAANIYNWSVHAVTETYERLSPGRYKIRATVRDGNNASNVYATAESPTFSITATTAATPSIIVTSPNGGQQWEIGQLNTITWSPYGYNPDVNPAKDVNVFLERLDGTTVGQIMDTGKASLHTYFAIGGYDNYAEPGTYYVRASNKVTGATDRSDASFVLLPRAVDIKVNGSDGPVTLSDNQPVTVTFKIGTTFSSCMLSGVRESVNGGNGVEFGNKYTIGSTLNGYAYLPFSGGSSTAIYVTCTKPDGTQRSDSVQVNVSGAASSIQVISPNGGEQIDPNQSMSIRFAPAWLSSVSVALYKNDQWKYWITKDFVPSGKDVDLVTWTPSAALQGLGISDNAGSIFKIYVTGQKADGTGYVDDKSDVSFGFTPPPVSVGAITTGVYEGSHPGVYGSYGVHPEGTVNVNLTGDTGQNRDLVLSSYEPVNWVINNPNNIQIGKITLVGYYNQRITNAPVGSTIEYHSYSSDGTYFYSYAGPTETGGGSYPALANFMNIRYGSNWYYQMGTYTGSTLNIYVGYKG